MVNRSVPTDVVLPHLVYCSVVDAAEWLARVLRFEEQYRYGEPVSGILMRFGEAYIMLTGTREARKSPKDAGCCTQMLTFFVSDVQTHWERAQREGALIWEDLHETIYGERQFGVRDLEGHRWLVSEHVRDVSPAEWGATVAAPGGG